MFAFKDLLQGITQKKRSELEKTPLDSSVRYAQDKEAYRLTLNSSEFSDCIVSSISQYVLSPVGQDVLRALGGFSFDIFDDQIEYREQRYNHNDGPDHEHILNYHDMGYSTLTEHFELPIWAGVLKDKLMADLGASYIISTPKQLSGEVYRLWDRDRKKGHSVKKSFYRFSLTQRK